MVYGLFCALPGVHDVLVTVISAMREHRRKLRTSQGVPEPRSFAVRIRHRSSISANTSTASRSTFRDDRDTPLCKRGGTAQDIQQFSILKNRNIFDRLD
jgi:hypothetical protein